MAIVTFTSDFGTKDHYVASVKAALLQACPPQNIVDISHEIRNCDIAQASFTCRAIYKDFPKGTVHLLAVGTNISQNHILAFHRGHFFIGPDNGLLSLVFGEETPELIIQVDNETQQPLTFPSKQLYAPIICKLLLDAPPESLGVQIKKIENRIALIPVVEDNKIRGHVVHIDHYGNLMTNISKNTFDVLNTNNNYRINFEYESHTQLDQNHYSRDFGDCVVFFNSIGLLEVAINQGNASELLGMKRESPVTIEFKK